MKPVPREFFIGPMDFFSILLPGALLTWLPEGTGIGIGPGKTFIGSEPGNIPKAGLVDPFAGPSNELPDFSLGPAIAVWPPPPSPLHQLRALAERLAVPLVDRAWQMLWGSGPQTNTASP
ncbi:hypothetical protein AEMCBJ_25870 [Cupriavidus necator]|uniref:hypothetical protein n=1 Tax=Cupriavidus necator TaxID=106590 RepID=UPI000ADFEFA2|nr:hypothetical protein [Cupriavidus necator]